MAKTFPFYLIYSFNFARKLGSSTLWSSLPEAQAACCLTYRAAAAQAATPLPCLATSDWSTLHKPVCRHDHEAIFSTLSTIIANLSKKFGFMH